MNAIKEARKIITANPSSADAKALSSLVLALESDAEFPLGDLYKLDLKTFDVAMDILGEWRLDRYYARKGKLLDVSYQARELNAH